MTDTAIARPETAASPDGSRLKVVAVSGSLSAPSKTTVLVEAIVEAVAQRRDVDAELIEVQRIGPKLAGAIRRTDLPDEVESSLRAIESADLLVVGTPVYRASFTGLFKHLFDFVGQYSLVDTPVLLSATGGSERHALTIEHQLRPLFGFFQALTLPIGVYGSDADFRDHRIASDDLRGRIDVAVERAVPLLGRRPAQLRPSQW
ncbi:FMN reductase [Homoserinibacter sp. YIM 151385]|uniref:FMN reductase n=1 Tax=Homoserinibacter sp. YIM 151385 TaxID=2985506 RepID=UPI0022F05CC9|nr:FMN reductase [Homoserinibacter sp. YIM 151385]WBU39098.1 FMN reductase [Homoserinibacter sp. YIM 151385]